MPNYEHVPDDARLSNSSSVEAEASRLLSLIEARCAYMQRESRRAIEAYLLDEAAEYPRHFEPDHVSDPEHVVPTPDLLSLDELERHARYWCGLLPIDPQLRAAVTRILGQKYRLAKDSNPGIATALGMVDQAVQDGYRQIYGESLDSLFCASSAPAQVKDDELRSGSGGDEAENTVREAARALEWLALPAGATLYLAGDADDALYIVISGRLRMSIRQEDGSEQDMGEVCRGELAGITEVMTGEPRAYDLYVIRDSEVVRLPAEALRQLAAQHPRVWARLSRVLVQRLRAQLARPLRARNTVSAVSIVAAGPEVPLAEFSRIFAEALATYGSTLSLDHLSVDEQLGEGAAQAIEGGLDYGRLTAWLGEQETRYRYVVYVADGGPSPWTDRCIRQADRVLVLANAASDPIVGECERRLTELAAQNCAELVLLQPANCVRPSGTSRWLAGRNLRGHHHLRAGVDRDVRRLARHLTGRALGLVLSGGGARGWAHLGVWRALTEAGVEVDLLGGTSMGALVGGALAMGLNYQEIERFAREFSGRKQLFDLTLPLVSFFSSGKVTAMLQHVYGDVKIEDLWHPFFCVASNLTCAAQTVLTEGPLWQAVRASLATPGIFAPLLLNGEVLVDGAVLNNLPTDVMNDFGEGGPIVAVNVFPEMELVRDYAFGPSVSGWDVLLRWLNPLKKSVQIPWVFENLARVVALNDVQQARSKRDLATVYIRPPVERFNILDFGAYEEIIELGYQAARSQIAMQQQGAVAVGADTQRRTPMQELAQTLAELGLALEKLDVGPAPASP